MKKVLIVSSVASMISQFNMPNLELLQEMGYEVHVACNFKSGNTCNNQSLCALKQKLKKMGITYFQIDFARNVYNLWQNQKAYKVVYNLMKNNQYSFLHCHSPIGGVIGRLAAVRTKTKVIYTAHGFHFYKGAPLENWLCYYPIERILARCTDILITINKEDYITAQKFKAKKVIYVPGVGIDLKRFSNLKRVEVKAKKRKELGLTDKTVMILSVGELNKNKNHNVVLGALSKLREADFHYYICGQGLLENQLRHSINSLNLKKKVELLGYRTDIDELYLAADIFVFPSIREGLSVALMEAMGSALPVVCANIRGNTDLVMNGKGGFLLENANDIISLSNNIEMLIGDTKLRNSMGKFNQKQLQKFELCRVNKIMKNIYNRIDK